MVLVLIPAARSSASSVLRERALLRSTNAKCPEATGSSFGTLPRQQAVILEKPEAQTLLFSLGNRRPQPTPNHHNSADLKR